MRACGLKGEVIVPAFTFIATAHAVTWEGAKPVFADIQSNSFSIDPNSIAKKITSRTSGVIAVNLFGTPCAIDEIQEVCRRKKVTLLFDSAQALGAEYKSQRLGGFGAAEVFSFHATKIINGFEGGAITTNDPILFDQLKSLRNFGFIGYDHVVALGTNAKMTEISAAVAAASLKDIDRLILRNKRVHGLYSTLLKGIPGLTIPASPPCTFQWHGFPNNNRREFWPEPRPAL